MMRYGQIAGNTSINETIYRCFDWLVEDDARLFARRFREQIADNDQVMHTFRELLVGGFLGSKQVCLRYERVIGGLTPDWSIVAPDGSASGVLELLNFHPARSVENQIKERRVAGRMWVGRIGPHGPRLYDRIRHKASKYKSLVAELNVPYVIALFSEFTANVDLDDITECVSDRGQGLFGQYPTVSGILFFEERTGCYHFTYVPNPNAAIPISLPSGTF